MNVQRGYVLDNLSKRYLSPILNAYSKEFISKFNLVAESLLGIGIADFDYTTAKGIKIVSDNHLFFVFDIKGFYAEGKYEKPALSEGNFLEFLKFIREYAYFVDDYYFNSVRGNEHCIVLRIPKKYEKAVVHMRRGEYSKMYTPDELKALKVTPKDRLGKPNYRYGVLRKTKEFKKFFEAELNEMFGTNITIDDKDDRELDLPYYDINEIFNYERYNIVVE